MRSAANYPKSPLVSILMLSGVLGLIALPRLAAYDKSFPAANQPGLDNGSKRGSGNADIASRRQVIARALQSASKEFDVPLPVLEAIALVQSRWNHIIPNGPADGPPSYGVMGLRDDDWFGHSLIEAASLVGASPEELREDPVANIRGGAALLAALADRERNAGRAVGQRLETWKHVVERYSGISRSDVMQLFALDVFRIVRDGYKEFGIDIRSNSALDMSIFSERIQEMGGLKRGQTIESLSMTSGYPLAIWMGPAATGNYEIGRNSSAVSLVIMHTTEGSAQSALSRFQTGGSGASAHYIVKQDGVIWQVVSDQDTAFHCGNLSFNHQAIGIELEGFADVPDFSWQTAAQNNAVQNLTAWLLSQYPIPLDRAHIIGHNEVPGVSSGSSPGCGLCAGPGQWGGCCNHHDPGAWWDWRRLMNALGHPPAYNVVTIQTGCSVLTRPQAGAPYITTVWPGQKFVSYDSYAGYYLIFLSGEEASQTYLGTGEFHWDGWIPSSSVTTASSATQLEVNGVFPSQLNIRDGTSSSSSILGRTIDGKRYVGTGSTQIGFDGSTWYQYDVAWDSGLHRGWSSGAYLTVNPGGGQTLSVALTATPASGAAPLASSLRADVSGTALGTINYSFWWNCNDPGTSVGQVISACGDPHDPSIGSKFDGTNNNPEVVSHTYPSTGTYFAKVIAERGTAPPAEQRVMITVTAPSLAISSLIPSGLQTRDWGEVVNYTITVVDTGGNPVNGATVLITDNLRSLSTSVGPTNTSGQASYTTSVSGGKQNGVYDIVFVASKSGFTNSTPITRQVQVSHANPSLTIASLTPTAVQTVDWGGTVTYNITVADTGSNPISGAVVQGQDALWGTSFGTSPTNNNGQTTYTTFTPNGRLNGIYDISFTASKQGYADSATLTRGVQVSHAGAITVSAPVAGNTWTVGTSQLVSWSTSGVIGGLNIDLSTDGGSTFPIPLAANAINAGGAGVTVPNTPSTACRVRVQSVADPTVHGDNPGNFRIVASPPNWVVQHNGGGNLLAVYFVDGNQGWAVGSPGTILHSTDGGVTWSPQTSPQSYYQYYTVYFADANNGWAGGIGGNGGVIVHTTNGGATWSVQYDGGEIISTRVWWIRGLDTRQIWAASSGGVLYTIDGGANWQVRVMDPLWKVRFESASAAWATTGAGQVIRTTDGGASWQTKYGGPGSILDIAFADVGAWGVGQLPFFKIAHTTDAGSTWQSTTSAVPTTLYSTSFVDACNGWASGGGGTIVNTTDGGATWNAVASLTSSILWDIFFNRGGGWAVGDGGIILKYTAPVPGLSIYPTSQSFPASASTGSITVVEPIGCSWTAVSNDPGFITVTSGGSSAGSSTVNYSVASNTAGGSRSGTITIAGQTFTIYQGAQFNDVPLGHPFYTEIGKLSARGLTLGCGIDNFCPNDLVTREQMAAFIMRAKGEFNPPTPGSQRFNDVQPQSAFYNFIDRLAALQITLGCTPDHLMFCPTDSVKREQMAAFILRGLGEFNPSTPASQRFNDVPPGNVFYNFIDRLAVLNITLGCTPDHSMYCPSDSVTRAQMAAFLVRAFNL